MLKAVEDISSTKKRLKIEIPADDIEKEILSSLEKMRREATLPGFRQGKAPMTLIEKRFGKRIESEVIDRMVPRVYVEALNKADITPVGNPVMEEEIDFRRHQPIAMTFTVEVLPRIPDLKYENLKVRDIPVAVEDADVEDVLRRSREEKATYEPSEGPIAMDDLLAFDLAAKDEGIELKDQIYKVGGSLFPADFFEKLLGRNKGDEFTLETTFPETHPVGRLAGKHLTMNVVIKDIKKAKLPEIDDEFAKDMGHESLEAMKKHIAGEILKAKKNEVAKIQKAELVKNLLDSYEFEAPESLVESELSLLVSSALMNRRRESGADVDAKDEAALKEELRPRAVRNVKGSVLIDIIGKKESVTVSDDELKQMIISMSRRFGVSPENLVKFYVSRDGSLEGLRISIFEDKVLDLILSKAEVVKGE